MDARQWPVREERLLTVHSVVGFLKAWKVTVVRKSATMPLFNSRRSTLEIVLSRKNLFSKFCKQGDKLDYSKHSQVTLYLPYVINGELLASHFY